MVTLSSVIFFEPFPYGLNQIEQILFIYFYIKLTSDSIWTEHTWQQFDSIPKFTGKIYVRQSVPDRGTL